MAHLKLSDKRRSDKRVYHVIDMEGTCVWPLYIGESVAKGSEWSGGVGIVSFATLLHRRSGVAYVPDF